MTSFTLTHIERTKQPGLALAGARWRAVFGVPSLASTTVITSSVMSTTGGRDRLPLKSGGAATASGERFP